MSERSISLAHRLRVARAWAVYYRYRLGQRVIALHEALHNPDQQNTWHLYGDIAWFGIVNGIVGTFVSVFAIRLGASDTLIGLLSSLPALINIFWQVPSARLVERAGSVGKITVASLFLQRLTYLLMALMPFVLLRYRAEAVVALVTLAALPGALGGVAFTTLLASSVSPDKRANLVSVRNMLLSLTSMLSVLVAGRLLDAILFPYNYQIIFGVAFLASLFSLHQVSKVNPITRAGVQPAVAGPASEAAAKTEKKAPLAQRLQNMWRDISAQKPFMRFTLGSFVFNWSLYFPSALYGLYRINELGATDTFLGLLSTVGSAVQIVMFMFWGRVMRQRGNRWVLLVSAFGLVGFPLFTGLSTRVEPLLLVAIWGALFSSAYSISNFDTLMSVCPMDRLPTYTALFNTLANVTAFIGPLLGTAVAGQIGLRYALILAGGLRLLGAFIMSRLEFGSPPPPYAGPDPLKLLKGHLANLKIGRRRSPA